MPQPEAPPVRIHATATIRARATEWFVEPAAVAVPQAHAFRGIRSVCGRFLWTAAWRVAGTLVDGAEAPSCPGCVEAVGLSPLEELALDGDR